MQFVVLWVLLNLHMSYRMLFLVEKKIRIRLTCLSQHVVTLFSVLYFLQDSLGLWVGGIGPLTKFHGYLALWMGKIAVLFTILIVVFVSKDATIKAPTNKMPLTVLRCARNLYTHYGSALVLWYSDPPVCKCNPLLLLMPLAIWQGLFNTNILYIYDVEGLSWLQFMVPMICGSVLYDVVVYAGCLGYIHVELATLSIVVLVVCIIPILILLIRQSDKS